MAEIISFPDEPDRLWTLVQKKIEVNDLLAAKEYLSQLCQLEDKFLYIKKYVSVLQSLGELQQALEIVENHIDSFLNEEEAFSEYIHLLLLDSQFLLAHRWLNYTLFDNSQLLMETKQLEQVQELFNSNERKSKLSKLMDWDKKQRPVLSKDWQNWIKNLTKDTFYEICQNYFEQGTNPFLQPKLVEELVQIGEDRELLIGNNRIDLSVLPLLEDSIAYKKGLTYIEDYLSTEIQISEMVLAEFSAHFALMYPFLPKVEEMKQWVNSYFLEYQGMFGDEEALEELIFYDSIQEKKQAIREIYQTLL